MSNVRFILKKIWIFLSPFFRTTYTANTCGHTTKQTGFIWDDDQIDVMTMPLAKNGKPDYCLKCINNMSIRCAWCGRSIIIDDPITLHIPGSTYKVPDYAIPYIDRGSKTFVGCLRESCSDAIDRAGFWVTDKSGEGRVAREPSTLEIYMGYPNVSISFVHYVDEISGRVKLDIIIRPCT